MVKVLNRELRTLFFLTMISIVLFPVWARPAENLIIKPVIDTSCIIESNYYKSQTNERSVRTFVLSPGLEFVYKTKKSSISAIVFISVIDYEDLSSVPAGTADSNDNDYVGHKIDLSAQTQLFTRITTGVDAGRSITRDPSEQERLSNSVDVDKYSITQVSPWLRYQLSDRFSSRVSYDDIRIDYSSDTREDSVQSGGTAGLEYELSDFTTIGLEYSLWKKDYDFTSSDYTSREYRANFFSKFKYFGFSGGAGFHEREFDQPGLNDIHEVSWDIGVIGRNPAELGDGEKPRSYMNLGFSQNFNNTAIGNEYYRGNRVTLALGHLFMEKIDARIDAYYQRSDYEGELTDRKDDTCFLSGSISYFFKKRFELTLKTGTESRTSSDVAYEYDNAFVFLGLTVNHD